MQKICLALNCIDYECLTNVFCPKNCIPPTNLSDILIAVLQYCLWQAIFSLIFTKLTHLGLCHQFKWVCEFPVWKFALICHWHTYWLAVTSVEHLTSYIVFQCTFYTKAKSCYIKMCKDYITILTINTINICGWYFCSHNTHI